MPSIESVDALKLLPPHLLVDDGPRVGVIVHGSPGDDMDFVARKTHPPELLDRWLREMEACLLVVGHTHKPMVYRSEAGLVINPGSVISAPRGVDLADLRLARLGCLHRDVSRRRERWAGRGRSLGRREGWNRPRFLTSRRKSKRRVCRELLLENDHRLDVVLLLRNLARRHEFFLMGTMPRAEGDASASGRLVEPSQASTPGVRIVRHAPFASDGRTIWDLVPEYEWFQAPADDGQLMDCHAVLAEIERRADGLLDDDRWRLAQQRGRYTSWSAEADTFGYDPETQVGAEFRYAAAGAIATAVEDDPNRLLQFMDYYRSDYERDPEATHPQHRAAVCRLIDDLHGNPFRPAIVRRDRVSETALDLARTIYEDRAFDLMPILGDALEEAGCTDGDILRHCRNGGMHARGCWVVDQVTMREWLPQYRARRNSAGSR